jgi:general secretion pathway protein D
MTGWLPYGRTATSTTLRVKHSQEQKTATRGSQARSIWAGVSLRSILKLSLMAGTILAFASSCRLKAAPEQGGSRHSLQDLAEGPPKLKPLSTSPINIKMVNDAKIIYETLGKIAGVNMIFDPDFSPRRIAVELTDLTIEQALDVVSLEAKAFWKPVTQNIVMVIPDQPQKRRDYEEQVVQTFYLSNTVLPQDLTEIVNGLRQLLDIKRIQQLNSQNAVIIRDTPDKLMLAEKIIHDVDTAKPEIIIQVEVLQTRRGKARQLGIQPDSTAKLSYAPPDSDSDNPSSPLSQIGNLATNYSITLPGATANALLSDNSSRIIQNPELRSVDGQPAKLRVGDRVPVATGSFSASASSVNPLVNTQFQYIDVGVNIDITPRIHPNHDISLKLAIEVSSVTGTTTIGGIQQPIISQRKIEHDIRLKEGEVSILAGLFENIDSKSLNGWPGLAHIPILRYLFSSESTDHQDNEVLIVMVPRIIRLPASVQAGLRPVSAGTESNVQTRREEAILTPTLPPVASAEKFSTAKSAPAGVDASPEPGPPARVRFEPETVALKAGQNASIDLVAENVKNLFSVQLLVQYDPKVVSIEEVRSGEFLFGGDQVIALVQRIDQEHGQALISLTRQPNTIGVSGSGILASLVVQAIGSGSSRLAIIQMSASNSEKKRLHILTGDASLFVDK